MERLAPAAAPPVGWPPVAAACFYAFSLSWSKAGCSIGFFLLLITCLADRGARARLAALPRHPLARVSALWLGVLLLGVALSPVRGEALEELRTHYPLLVVFLTSAAVVDAGRRRMLLAALLGGALAASLPAVAQRLGLITWQDWRFHGTIGVLPYAGLMALAWALCAWFSARLRNPLWRTVALLGSLIALLAAWMNGTRIALAAIPVCAVAMLVFGRGQRIRLIPALATLLLLPLVSFMSSGQDVTLQRISGSGFGGGVDAERAVLWDAGVQMFLDQPLLGVGMGNFRARFDEMLRSGELPEGVEEGHVHETAHSQVLHVLATQGVLGLAGFLAWAVAGLALVLRRLRAQPEEAMPVLFGVVVVSVFGLTDTSLQESGLFGILALSLGVAAGLPQPARAASGAGAAAAAEAPHEVAGGQPAWGSDGRPRL